MKYFLLVTTALWSAFGHSTGPRWRYVALPENPDTRFKREARDVNESGQIAIYEWGPDFFGRSGIYSVANSTTIWAPPSPINLSRFEAIKILDGGELSGRVTAIQPVTWTPSGGYNYLPTSSEIMHPTDVNNNRGFIGYVPQFAGRRVLHYFDKDGYRVLHHGFDLANAHSINDAGYIAGNLAGSSTNEGQDEIPVLWDPYGQSYRVLTSPNQRYGSAYQVTNSGIVYGVVSKDGPNPGWYGVWWDLQGNVLRERYLTDLGFYGVHIYSGPYGSFKATESGDLYYYDDVDGINPRARFYSPLTGQVDITALTEGLPAGSIIRTIRGHNEAGFLTGDAVILNSNGQRQFTQNFYLEPVPEPATLAALGVGFVAILRRKKVRCN